MLGKQAYNGVMSHLAWLLIALSVTGGCATDDKALRLPRWHLWCQDADLGEVTLPTHLTERLPVGDHSFELRSDFVLPAEYLGRDLWLLIPYYEGGVRLRIDGIEQMPRQAPINYRHHGVYRWHLGARHENTAAMHVSMAISGAFVQTHWLDTVPVLSQSPDTALTWAIDLLNERLALMALGIMAQVLLTLCLLYGFRRERQYLWFALETVGASTYNLDLLGVSGMLFGRYDTTFAGLSLCIAAVASVFFLYAHFNMGKPPRIWYAMVPLACGLAFLFSLDNGTTMPWIVFCCLVPATVENIRICSTLVYRGQQRIDAAIILAAWVVLSVVVCCEFCPWLGLGEVLGGMRLGGVGLGAFGMTLCLLLTTGYGQAMQRTDALNAELLRQVKDRSRQMYNALALAGGERRAPMSLDAGQTVQGRYRIVKSLGVGGMGAVYEVVRIADNVPLALKVTRNVDGRALARLAKEAELGLQVTDSHVVSLMDVDVADAGFIYIVMELIHGPPLEACRSEIIADPAATLLVLRHVSRGLQALHRHGIIHRDLKPANVLTNYPWAPPKKPIIKIADFGISKIEAAGGDPAETSEPIDMAHLREEQSTIYLPNRLTPRADSSGAKDHSGPNMETEAGRLMGTPRYMAPELALGSAMLSPAADIFSFGVIAYELLMDADPFDIPPVLVAAEGKAFVPAGPLQGSRVRGIAPEVLQMLQRCLANKAQHRPTATDLIAVL